jgi:hypothetical protein
MKLSKREGGSRAIPASMSALQFMPNVSRQMIES